jgi:hypothetical protein
MSVDTLPGSFLAASSSSYTFSGEGPAATALTKPDLRPSAKFREGLRRQRGDSHSYSNKSWSIVAHGMFQLREIDWMERTSKTTSPPSTNPFPPPPTGTTTAPSHGECYPLPPKSLLPPPSVYITPPTTPDTPSPSYSTLTSPASRWHECRASYPHLSRMATDYLTIPGMPNS